jgi:signal peptidase I
MADLVAEAFTNEFGQTIQPGDEVVYVGTGYGHSVRVNKGKFAGVYYDTGRYYLKDEKGQYIRDEKGNTQFEMKQYVKAVRVDGIPRKTFKYDYKLKKGEYVETLGCAILPLKRVYKVDVTLKDFTGKYL